MGNPIPASSDALDGFKIDISHQEMDRIIDELEQIYQSQPTAWLPTEAIGMMLAHELGYEDTVEFEDALKSSWVDFLSALPHIEVRIKEGDGNTTEFRMLPPPPEADRVKTKMTLRVEAPHDLWRVCLKAPNAVVEIPELEFEIGADRKRHIDSIYNHVSSAIFNLDMHLSVAGQSMSDSDRENILFTVNRLSELLDIKEPWTFIVNDPDGMSEVKPKEGVVVEIEDKHLPVLTEEEEENAELVD